MNIEDYEKIHPHVETEGLTWSVPNRHALWRLETLRTKEPDTIRWIESMPAGSVFFDIGANIGQYSLFAAKRGLKVHAFEPESQNFALLNRNISLNPGLDIAAWPFALSNEHKIAQLHLSAMIAGGSCHAFDQNLDYNGHPKQFQHVQGSISLKMDEFAAQFELPNHIKIDVDGFEHLVCEGADTCLASCESVLVEINTHYTEHLALARRLQSHYGFKIDRAQIDAAMRTAGSFAGIGNWIFFKGDNWHAAPQGGQP